MNETLAAAESGNLSDHDPAAERVLEALRQRLAGKEPDFIDGAVKLCVEMEWAGVSARRGQPGVVKEIMYAAKTRLHHEPSWLATLEEFVGEEAERSHLEKQVPTQRCPSAQPKISPCEQMAQQYAAMGWPVMPVHSARNGACTCHRGAECTSPGKHPRTKNGFKDATTDPAKITEWFRQWPNANVGIRTGAASGLVALDVDPRHGGDANLVELQRLHGELPGTLIANTGSGGRHLLFKHPGASIGNPTGLAGFHGLDVRGDGGYIVAPPSTHASGGTYNWVGKPAIDAVSTAPSWFFTLVNKRQQVAGSSIPRRPAVASEIPEGERNDRLFRLGCRLRDQGRDRDAILAGLLAENESRCQPPLDTDEVEQIADNAAAYDAGIAFGDFEFVAPVPEGTPAPDMEHPKLGPAVSSHSYQNGEGHELWRVCTYWDQQQLVSRPLTLWKKGDVQAWKWKGPPAPRPLFRLPTLVARADLPVLLLISEAAAERAAGAFPSWAATCPMFGGKGVDTADWTSVAGRDVLVWAANTNPGRTFVRRAAAAARGAGAARVATFTHDRRPGPENSLTSEEGRFDGGEAPSTDAGWTEAHLIRLFDDDGISAPDPMERISLIRDNEDKLPAHRLNAQIAEHVQAEIRRRGQLYCEGDVAYAFLWDRRLLVELNEDDPNFVRMLAEYGINRSEQLFTYVANSLWVEATARGVETKIRYLSHYDRARNAIYVYNQGGLVYKVTTAGIETIDNGADGVLFLGEPGAESFNLVEGFDPAEEHQDGLNPIKRLLADGLSLAPGLLTREDALMLLAVWIYGLFVPELMPTKPILALVGQKGSAKTALAKRIGLMLFGSGFDVASLTNDSKDFDAAASASALLVLDNVDTEKSWLPDKLATLATGGRLMKRVLYTTNQVAPFRARCWAVVTSRTPPFKRDDVAERLLLLRTERRNRFVAQADLDRRTLEQRDLLMTNLLHDLVGVVEALRDHGAAEMASDFRMADYYAFAMRVARHLNIETAMAGAFLRLQQAQGEFAIEDDPVPNLIEIWLRQARNVGRKVPAKELFAELGEIGRANRLPFKDNMGERAFSQHLAQIVEGLRTRFAVDESRPKKTAHYAFRPLPTE